MVHTLQSQRVNLRHNKSDRSYINEVLVDTLQSVNNKDEKHNVLNLYSFLEDPKTINIITSVLALVSLSDLI